MDKIAVTACPDYGEQTVIEAVERQFSLLGLDSLIGPGKRVLIKPNLIGKRAPEQAATTHPMVVRGVIRALKKRGAEEIVIADSNGGVYTPSLLRSIYDGTGMTSAAQAEGARLNFDTSFETVSFPQGRRCRQFSIIKPVLEADVIINVAKLKTHAMTALSGACKNLFGCVPGLQKPELHCRFPHRPEFGEMLTDLCALVAPAVSLVDGVIAMEGNGPTGGSPRKVGCLIGGENPHAVDLALCAVTGLDPRSVPTLESALNRGLAPAFLQELELAGDSLHPFLIPGFKKPDSRSVDFLERLPCPLRRPASFLLTPKPVIVKSRCVGCNRCGESCPRHTIQIRNRKAVIDYKSCIKCYCCHEMCPVKAVDIRRFTFFKL